MVQSAVPRRILAFGPFEVDVASGELRREGLRVRLQDQPLRLLMLLLERAGEVVTREELRNELWPADTFVDFDHGLNTAVKKLREALGDSAEASRYVETLARRGYRFLAPVRGRESAAPSAPSSDEEVRSPAQPAAVRPLALPLRLVLIAVVLGAAALVAYRVGTHKGPPVRPGPKTLAVLPFDNLSGEADQEYLSDGLTEEMITQLARLDPRRLKVTARSSTWKYKRVDRDLPRLRQELGADYVLEGSVRRAGERVRVTAQLVQVVDQTHIWVETYEREMRDVLVLESDVARSVARAITMTLAPEVEARLSRAHPVRPESYQDYLRGRYFSYRRTEAALRQALSCFRQAIDADPGYAPAYSGLADSYSSLGASSIVGGLPPRQAMPEAKAAALEALEIDGSLAEAHTSLAIVHLLYDWDLAASEKEFKRALELAPDDTAAHHWYSHCLLLLGRTEESLAESKRALELEPLHLVINIHLGWHYLYARQYDEAIEQYRRTLELDPTFPQAKRYSAWALLQKGRRTEAVAALQAALSTLGRQPEVEAELGYALAVAGRRGEARAVLEGLSQLSPRRYVSPYSVALVHVGLADRDQALAWLDKAYAERSDYMAYLGLEPMLDPLRSDPRFDALLRRVGLPRQ